MDAAMRLGGLRRGRDLERSLTLLQVFLLASAVMCAVAGVTLGWILSRSLEAEALNAERSSLVTYVDGVARPELVSHDHVAVSRWGKAQLSGLIVHDPDLLTVKVWRTSGAKGVLAWTNVDRSRIGQLFPLDDLLGDAIHDNHAVAALVGAGNSDGEDSFERNQLAKRHGLTQLFEVYAPIDSRATGKPIGAYEIYASPKSLTSLIGSRRTMIWLAVAVVFAALWVVLALLVRGASNTLRARTARLAESNRLLEESALEAVESLNAAVDAKDPYTAGHSLRVQRIAVALGEELGLDRAQLETLKFAGLFHDIGKIAIPDTILMKPERLTDEEFEIVKRHPEDGARIVGRLQRLRAAVPAILHHHERWDGTGYPRGLAREEIPVEAAIVGLADAVDAMTTDRPYSPARSLDEAAEEIVRNRATQFSPAAVDAFLAVVDRTPELFGIAQAVDELALV